MTRDEHLQNLDFQLEDYCAQSFNWKGVSSPNAIKVLASIAWVRANVISEIVAIPSVYIDGVSGFLEFFWEFPNGCVYISFRGEYAHVEYRSLDGYERGTWNFPSFELKAEWLTWVITQYPLLINPN